jgi:hypothetical protein
VLLIDTYNTAKVPCDTISIGKYKLPERAVRWLRRRNPIGCSVGGQAKQNSGFVGVQLGSINRMLI